MMLRLAMLTFLVGSLVALGARDVRACSVPCACLDADQGGIDNDLVCCGVFDDGGDDLEVEDALDAVAEGQACGLLFAGAPGFPSSLVQIGGRVSSEGVMGCGCLDVDQDGTAEAVETFPPDGDCARTAALACLSGHQPPARDCATISYDSSSCVGQ